MPAIKAHVSTNDSMTPFPPVGPSPERSIRIVMCYVLALLVTFATPWNVEAAPSSARQPASSQMHAAAPGDNDGDGIPDEMDPDDDNDDVADSMDADPFNAGPTPKETPDIIAPDQDSDHDGIDNIMDPDDDNDVIEDDEDPAPFTPAPPADTLAPPADTLAPPADTPAPPADTPVPPTEIPETPVMEGLAPAQLDKPEVEQPAPQPPDRPGIDEPEPFTVQSEPQDTAPLVVALPSTGGIAEIEANSSWTSLLATLSVFLGSSGFLIRRRSSQMASKA